MEAQNLQDTVEGQKKPWLSKTHWTALLTVVVPFVYPPASAWIAAHPELYSAALGAIFSGLRQVTKDKIVIK